ncbi:MAG: FAD-dependent monooxygenase [Pseudomonadota bacterium]
MLKDVLSVMVPNPYRYSDNAPSIVVSGAGIGGLTAALIFSKLGYRVSILDSAKAFEPLGAGLCLNPRAVSILEELGLRGFLASRGVVLKEVHARSLPGDDDFQHLRGPIAQSQSGSLLVHRGLLHQALYDAVRSRLGNRSISTGTRVLDVEENGDQLSITASDRTQNDREITVNAGLLIAADGIHSKIRRAVSGHHVPPHPAEFIIWRGLIEMEPPFGAQSLATIGDQSKSFTLYPISRVDPKTGHALFTWIAKAPAGKPYDIEGHLWQCSGDRATARQAFSNWSIDGWDIQQTISSTETILEHRIFQADAPATWANGRVALIGDAAHPQTASRWSGASQAIIDATLLGAAVAENGPTEAAFAEYGQWRETDEILKFDEFDAGLVPPKPKHRSAPPTQFA